jgi:acetolactate synthase-1/2/3 large subunit
MKILIREHSRSFDDFYMIIIEEIFFMIECNGSRILIEALIEQGVEIIFGYPGGKVLHIYDELYKQRERIRHILVSHEQHASHAADGYARSTGKVGVCLATSGPGATNLVTGIATAYMDSVPMVAITGNVPTNLLGKDSFQEVDIAGVTMPIVKHNWIVRNVDELAEVVREAFIIAQSGRPGPVLIDIPQDITSAMGKWIPQSEVDSKSMSPQSQRLGKRISLTSFTDEDISKAAKIISNAKRPVIYAGGGVIISDASSELKQLAEKLHAPVSLSLMGIGAFPYDHPLYTGMIGMHGTVASNNAIQQADVILAIGARFSDRVISKAETFAPSAKIIHFDIDPAEINKMVRSYTSVIGNVKKSLQKILEVLPAKMMSEWNGSVDEWKQKIPASYLERPGVHPRFILEETAKAVGDDAIIVTDVGQHQMWTGQFYPFNKPRSFLTSGGFGTMGFGLGAAEGAKLGNPNRPVVLFTGDGCFRMNCGELAAISNYKIPILVVIFNNGVLGMVRQWQTMLYDKHYSETTLDRPPDFIKLAEAYGVAGYTATDEAAFIEALAKGLKDNAEGRTAIINAIIDKDENVLPMVPGGKAIDDQIM